MFGDAMKRAGALRAEEAWTRANIPVEIRNRTKSLKPYAEEKLKLYNREVPLKRSKVYEMGYDISDFRGGRRKRSAKKSTKRRRSAKRSAKRSKRRWSAKRSPKRCRSAKRSKRRR